MRIPLTQYGRREIAIASVVCGAAVVLAVGVFPPGAAVPLAVWLCVLMFFRDPPRRPQQEAFLSPADGKVVEVAPLSEHELVGEGVRIGVFMSLLDVHVNRSPCAGEVARIDHHDGGYVDARRPEASERNESATIVLNHARWGQTFPVVVRQVAGLVARRIVTDLSIGQRLAPGQRIGMVKFGSRVELMLPDELVGEVLVRVGQKVRAGRTVLVRPPLQEPSP